MEHSEYVMSSCDGEARIVTFDTSSLGYSGEVFSFFCTRINSPMCPWLHQHVARPNMYGLFGKILGRFTAYREQGREIPMTGWMIPISQYLMINVDVKMQLDSGQAVPITLAYPDLRTGNTRDVSFGLGEVKSYEELVISKANYYDKVLSELIVAQPPELCYGVSASHGGNCAAPGHGYGDNKRNDHFLHGGSYRLSREVSARQKAARFTDTFSVCYSCYVKHNPVMKQYQDQIFQ